MIRFTRLPSRNQLSIPKVNHINESQLCRCCESAEAGGYIGNGTVITGICPKCYRRNSIDRDHAKNPKFHCMEGRS